MDQLRGFSITQIAAGVLVAFVAGLLYVFLNGATSKAQISDWVAVGQAMPEIYLATGPNYGTAAIPASVLINGARVPTASVSGTNLVTRAGQVETLQGAGSGYTLTAPGISVGTCTQAVTDAELGQFLTSVQVNGTTVPEPVTPATIGTATSACSGAGTVQLVLNYSGT
jgi:hypothetical protein